MIVVIVAVSRNSLFISHCSYLILNEELIHLRPKIPLNNFLIQFLLKIIRGTIRKLLAQFLVWEWNSLFSTFRFHWTQINRFKLEIKDMKDWVSQWQCSVMLIEIAFFHPNRKYPVAAPNTTAKQSQVLYVMKINISKKDNVTCMRWRILWKKCIAEQMLGLKRNHWKNVT